MSDAKRWENALLVGQFRALFPFAIHRAAGTTRDSDVALERHLPSVQHFRRSHSDHMQRLAALKRAATAAE